MAKLLLSLRNSLVGAGMPDALHRLEMMTLNPNCPISTRTAYFGARRIAPVAATSRFEACGARPAVEVLRPARPKSRPDDSLSSSNHTTATGAFVAHVIGQFAPREPIDPRMAANRYASAFALGDEDPCLRVALL